MSWDKVKRLDATTLAAEVVERTGIELVVEGPCPGGEVGAAYVRRPDGHRSVLKWRPGQDVDGWTNGPQAVADAVRAVGTPAPATELAVQVGDAVVTIQELMPGRVTEVLTHELLDQALELNERHAGLGPSGSIELFLLGDGPGFCLHEPIREYDAELLERIEAVGHRYGDRAAGPDAVHVDFHPGNLLVSGDRITAVIDWDGAAWGDRRLDLVTLRFGLRPGQVEPGVIERLDAELDSWPEHVLQPLWAHLSLRMVDWSIRHFTAAETRFWHAVAETRLA